MENNEYHILCRKRHRPLTLISYPYYGTVPRSEYTLVYIRIITEHESLHKKKRFDWTLRGHDP